jgi:diketogulonate reductase-like aldo/keto reductase
MEGIMSTAHSTRRDFIRQLAATGIALPHTLRRFGQEAMRTRAIPATGEVLPVVGFGSSKAVLEIPARGTEALEAVLRAFVARGGRVVDTSPRTEAIDAQFGRLLQLPELKDALFVTAKINTTGAQAGTDQMRQSQRLFGRRPLDLVQVESMRDVETHWPNLRAWKDAGDARYIGVTVSSDDAHGRLEAFMRTESPDFVHVNYSVVETRAEQRILPLAHERGMAVLINRPFMNGAYFRRVEGRALPPWAAEFDCATWAQFSLKYIVAQPAVTCVLAETTDPGHMADNLGAAFGRLPDDATRQRMRDLMRTV